MVFIRTSPFRKKDAQYSRSVVVPLRRPCADTADIVSSAVLGLQTIYRPGFNFAKAGVILVDLQPAEQKQFERDLEGDEPSRDRARLMQALDVVNDRWGKGTMRIGSSKPPGAAGRLGNEAEAPDAGLHNRVGCDAGGPVVIKISSRFVEYRLKLVREELENCHDVSCSRSCVIQFCGAR